MATKAIQSLRRDGLALPDGREALIATAGGLFAGLCLALAVHKAGAIGAVAPGIAIAGLVLLRYPGTLLAIMIGGAILFEPSDPGLLPTTNVLFGVIGSVITPADLLLFAALAGLLLRFAIDSERPVPPKPLTPVLALLAAAVAAGVVTVLAANVGVPGGEIYHRVLNDVYIIAIPVVMVNTVRGPRALRGCLIALAALASVKGLSGIYAVLAGSGLELEGESASYLDPMANLVMMIFVFGVGAAMIRKIRMPLWIYGGSALALIALFLSYRRSFWIAIVLGLIAVGILASRYRGRTVLATAAGAAVLGFFAIGAVGSIGATSGPLGERVQTLNPAGEDTNRGDQYRTDERHNVIATLKESPLTGVGLGGQWKVHQPIAEAHPRNYVHFAFLWFWLELGPLGALAYALLLLTGLWLAWRVLDSHPDPLVQVGAIAAFATVVGIIVVELTATFTGVDPRFSIMVGALLGWLAAAWRDVPEANRGRGFLGAARA